MKKIFFLPAIVSFGIFALAGCGNTTDGGNTTEKVFRISELVNIVVADKDGWKGKEVTVSGNVSHSPSSDGANGYVINMNDEHNSDSSQWQITCKVPQGDIPRGIVSKPIEVKGKIGLIHTQSYLNLKSVTLDSCELKK